MHFKLEVVAYAETYNKLKAAKDKKVPRSCVKDWTKQKPQLEAQLKASSSCSISSSKRLQGAGPPLKDKDFDEKLINWASEEAPCQPHDDPEKGAHFVDRRKFQGKQWLVGKVFASLDLTPSSGY